MTAPSVGERQDGGNMGIGEIANRKVLGLEIVVQEKGGGEDG